MLCRAHRIDRREQSQLMSVLCLAVIVMAAVGLGGLRHKDEREHCEDHRLNKGDEELEGIEGCR